MYVNKCRNTINAGEEDTVTPQKEHSDTLILDCVTGEISKKKFRRMIVRLLKNMEKQLHELKKSMNCMDRKLHWEI